VVVTKGDRYRRRPKPLDWVMWQKRLPTDMLGSVRQVEAYSKVDRLFAATRALSLRRAAGTVLVVVRIAVPFVVGVKAEEHLEGATAFVGDVDERIAGERVIPGW